MYLRTIVICDRDKGINTKLAADTDYAYGPLRSTLIGKRLGDTVPGEVFFAEFRGYVFRILGGNDRMGRCMRQGILTNRTVRILMRRSKKGVSWKKCKDQRMRRTARGCIIGDDIRTLSLEIVQRGVHEIPGLSGPAKPKSLGPKRAAKIRKMFELEKKDDVKNYVVRRKRKNGKTKAPRIQRLVTPERIRRGKTIAKAKEERFERRRRDVEEYKREKGGRLQKAKRALKAQAQVLIPEARETKREEGPQPAEGRGAVSLCWRDLQG